MTCNDLIKSSVRHGSVTIVNNGMVIKPEHCHYIMLPVWMVNIKYKDKMYTFAMNGQTGKAIGDGPIGIVEIIIWSIIFFVILFAIGFIFALFMF